MQAAPPIAIGARVTETQTPAPAAPLRPWLLATLALVVAQAVTLAAMGQPLSDHMSAELKKVA